MKKKFFKLIPLISILLVVGTALFSQGYLQNSGNKDKSKDKKKINEPVEISKSLSCKSCHESEYPTKNDPGLRSCPRNYMISDFHSPQEGPDVITINEMSDNYNGVVFSHRIHSQMSAMSTGCTGCHHYNTTGPIMNCRDCHESSRMREDVSVPDLKAAFHRQCMTCHKQWSHDNGCSTQCHTPKGSEVKNLQQKINDKSHPTLTEPKKMVWETNYASGKIVTFFHDEHNQTFKISCKTCHSSDNCTKCHDSNVQKDFSNPVKIKKSFEDHHKPCIDCHSESNCQKCHQEKEMTPFNHGKTTGWALNSHHNQLACTKCHGNQMPFKKLDRNCTSCHKNFTPGNFNHEKTGLVLSDNHKDMECISCHINGDFSKPPVCTTCHDDKSYPAQLPGKKGKK